MKKKLMLFICIFMLTVNSCLVAIAEKDEGKSLNELNKLLTKGTIIDLIVYTSDGPSEESEGVVFSMLCAGPSEEDEGVILKMYVTSRGNLQEMKEMIGKGKFVKLMVYASDGPSEEDEGVIFNVWLTCDGPSEEDEGGVFGVGPCDPGPSEEDEGVIFNVYAGPSEEDEGVIFKMLRPQL